MPIDVLMPALSPTMEKGTLAKWVKQEGDKVKSGDVLAEIETDKATMEVEAVDEGILGKILVAEGTADVPVNQLIAVILEEGEDQSLLENRSVKPAAAKTTSAPKEAVAPASTEAPKSAPPVAANTASAKRVFSSPLARRIAKNAKLDLAQITGSGPKGRVVKADVEKAIQSGQGKSAGVAAPQGMSDEKIRAMYAADSFEVVPHDSMRKIIATRLMESKLTVPHFYLTRDVDLDALLSLRTELNAAAAVDADGKPAYKISVNDFIIKALGMSLKAVPEANVTWTDSGMLKHRQADVGVAVAIPNGLLTPVVRNVESKSLAVISNEMKDLAARARAKRLKPEEYQGGTTAISNLGMYGIKDFAAIINPPHSSILAVGAGEQRAVVRNGQIVIAHQMSVTLSTDHRAVDGALGAEFVAAFKEFIEKPLRLMM